MESVFFAGKVKVLLFSFLMTAVLPLTAQNNPCLPSYSQQEINVLESVEDGDLVLNTTTGCINYFVNGRWKAFCGEDQDEPARGTVEFDSTTGFFNYFDGNRWIPFDTYAKQYENYQKPKKSAVNETPPQLTETQQEEGNGEIMFEQPEATSKTELARDDCSFPPSQAYAGKDLVNTEDVYLEAGKPAHGIGYWEIIRGDSGLIHDMHDPHSLFSGQRGTTYQLQWNVATLCDTSFDDLLVRIRFPCKPEPSPSYAGVDKLNVDVCYLNGNYPKKGQGSWQIIQGVGGYIEQPENPKSAFTGQPGKAYVLRWIIRTQCGYTQDDVKITFKAPCNPKPSKANAGPDQLDVMNCTLSAGRPEFGKGRWFIVSGKGGRLLQPSSPTSEFTGLPKTTYRLKWVVSTECGKSEDGMVVRFLRRCPSVITDERDGQKYRVAQIGNQCWMGENLNYQGTEYHCYGDFPDNCEDFGALYQWERAMDYSKREKSQGICPKGWHVPSDEEWETLLTSKEMQQEPALLKSKEGFNILYGGTRYPNGRYFNKKEYGFYWSSSANSSNTAWNRYFHKETLESAHYSTDVENGFSVRCIQD